MPQRIGTVSITPKVRDREGIPFPAFYDSFGKNTGNYMFTQAMFRTLAGDVSHVGFAYDPDRINRDFDHIVVPAANWLNAGANWDWLTDIIERTDIPVTVIGIGLQADTTDLAQVKVSDSAVRFIKAAARKSPLISTRGDFTRDWLHSIGVRNAVTTGCPSLYMRLDLPAERSQPTDTFVVQSTRYAMTPGFLNATGANRRLFELSGRSDAWMVYQSEPEELEYLACDRIPEGREAVFDDLLPPLYGQPDRQSLQAYLDRRGKVFFDLDEWAGFLQQTAGVIGTRLHGSIIALNADVPAVLVPHDSRTREVADFAGIPVLTDLSRLDDQTFLREVLQDVDMSQFVAARTRNSDTYRSFLVECGLRPNDARMF